MEFLRPENNDDDEISINCRNALNILLTTDSVDDETLMNAMTTLASAQNTTDDMFYENEGMPWLMSFYTRLRKVDLLQKIMILIPTEHKFSDKFSKETASAIGEYILELAPVVSKPKIERPINRRLTANIIDKLDDIIAMENANVIEFENHIPSIVSTMPPMTTILDVAWLDLYPNIDPCKLYTPTFTWKHSKLMFKYLVNTLIAEGFIESYTEGAADTPVIIDDYLHFILGASKINATSQEMLKVINVFWEYVNNFHLEWDSPRLITVLTHIRDAIEHTIDVTSDLIDYKLIELEPKLSIINTINVEFDNHIDWFPRINDYAVAQILPHLKLNKCDSIKLTLSDESKFLGTMFLTAFPYHNQKHYHIDVVTGELKCKPLTIGNVSMIKDDDFQDKFMETLNGISLQQTNYTDIITFLDTQHYTSEELLFMLRFVYNFYGYNCNFVATYICRSLLCISDIRLVLMHSIIRSLPQKTYNELSTMMGAEKEICSKERDMEYNENFTVNLKEFYTGCVTTFHVIDNVSELAMFISQRTSSFDNKADLQMMCSQYVIAEPIIMDYLHNEPRVIQSPLKLFVLCRLLMNLPNLSIAEYNFIQRIADRCYILSNDSYKNKITDNNNNNIMWAPKLVLRSTPDFYVKNNANAAYPILLHHYAELSDESKTILREQFRDESEA